MEERRNLLTCVQVNSDRAGGYTDGRREVLLLTTFCHSTFKQRLVYIFQQNSSPATPYSFSRWLGGASEAT